MHDYLATRLSNAFQDDLLNLPQGEEVWVMDYIENFQTFAEFALQQDHFGHKAVTIFIILCVRHRRDDELVVPTFKLPDNLTGELHCFLSDDMDHDVGFAQMCIHMVMQSKERRGFASFPYGDACALTPSYPDALSCRLSTKKDSKLE